MLTFEKLSNKMHNLTTEWFKFSSYIRKKICKTIISTAMKVHRYINKTRMYLLSIESKINNNPTFKSCSGKALIRCFRAKFGHYYIDCFDYRKQFEKAYRCLNMHIRENIVRITVCFTSSYFIIRSLISLDMIYLAIILIIYISDLLYLAIISITRQVSKKGDNIITVWSKLIFDAICHLRIVIITYLSNILLITGSYNNIEKLITFLMNAIVGTTWLSKLLSFLIHSIFDNIYLSIGFFIICIYILTAFYSISSVISIELYLRIFAINKEYEEVNIFKYIKINWLQKIVIFLTMAILLSYELNNDKMLIFGPRILLGILITFILHYINILIIYYRMEKDYKLNYSNLTLS